MSAAELAEWFVFDRSVEPFGDEWRQTATLAAMMCRQNGVRCKVEDFMPLVKTSYETVSDAMLDAVLGPLTSLPKKKKKK